MWTGIERYLIHGSRKSGPITERLAQLYDMFFVVSMDFLSEKTFNVGFEEKRQLHSSGSDFAFQRLRRRSANRHPILHEIPWSGEHVPVPCQWFISLPAVRTNVPWCRI